MKYFTGSGPVIGRVKYGDLFNFERGTLILELCKIEDQISTILYDTSAKTMTFNEVWDVRRMR